MQALIETTRLSKWVRAPDGSKLSILTGIDLRVQSGEAVAILGASGSGKSTLLGLLAGLDTASDGEIRLLGADLGALDEDRRAALRAGRVGFVFQSFQLIQGMSALQNVALGLQLAGRKDALQQAAALLEDVGLGARQAHLPQQLSGGEQQRVAIARAFAGEPEVLFADEPTGNLDADTGAQIMDLMFALRDRRRTALILVTHDQTLARRCDRILTLHRGRLESAS